ncbi:MAG: hypothetical protein HKL80_03260 [Acidimicrobiales bacterium]|nr:hypothetical protein [Acidimicrobiales bacterium]
MSNPLIARCIGSTGADLGPATAREFHSDRTKFGTTIGAWYQIFGMGIWETVFVVLVRDDYGKPSWLPIGLFDFEISKLPSDWEFRLIDGIAASGGDASNRWVAVWGYSELVRNPSHSDALLEREPEALRIFDQQLQGTPPIKDT